MYAVQGRLLEIEVLQKQISKAHEELLDLRFKLKEQRAEAASKKEQLNADKQQLQSQVEALSHQKERLQLEVDAAITRAANHEKQQQQLYDLCNTLQGECACNACRKPYTDGTAQSTVCWERWRHSPSSCAAHGANGTSMVCSHHSCRVHDAATLRRLSPRSAQMHVLACLPACRQHAVCC